MSTVFSFGLSLQSVEKCLRHTQPAATCKVEKTLYTILEESGPLAVPKARETSIRHLYSTSNHIYFSFYPHKRQINDRDCELLKFNCTFKMSIIPGFFSRGSSNVFDPFSLNVWDPFQALNSSVFRDSAGPSLTGFATDVAAVANTQIDWKETPNAHIFKADLPGLKKDEVKIEVADDRILQISGEHSKEKEDKNEKFHRVERSQGKFLRRFRLPENAKVEEVKAAMENGVLTVTVPKQPEPKPQVKSIEIAS